MLQVLKKKNTFFRGVRVRKNILVVERKFIKQPLCTVAAICKSAGSRMEKLQENEYIGAVTD